MKKLYYSLNTILYTYLLELLSIIIGALLYTIAYHNLSTINTSKLYLFITSSLTIFIIPTSIYLYKKYKIKETPTKKSSLLLMIPLGVTLSLFYNNLTFNLIENKNTVNISIYIIILYSAIIGPIFEELIFRYISYNKAKSVYGNKLSIFLTTLVFAITHQGIINIIYAFILGLLLIYTYKIYHNIAYPIIIHISANLTSIFISNFNKTALILSTLSLIIYFYYFYKKHS